MSRKAAVLGAAGGIGQPLSLLMKQNPHLTELALFDVVPVVRGVAADLSHINTPSVVKGYTKDDEGMKKALSGCFMVVIPAGVPRKPGMTRDDLFKINGGICKDIAEGIAQNCPDAFVLVISNPVNSTVPIFAEVFKKAGTFDPKKLFGVTTLDIVRASTFVTEVLEIPNESSKYAIPVVGGHSGKTIVPLLSQSEPKIDEKLLGDKEKVDALINRIQFGGDEVVKAKDGAGSATLSMAYAGYRFAESLIKVKFGGESGIVEDSYVHISAPNASEALASVLDSSASSGIDFFSLPVELGPDGIKTVQPLSGEVSDYEKGLLKECVEELKGSIVKGQEFITGKA